MYNPFLSGMAFSHWVSVFLVGFSFLLLRTDAQGELLCETKRISLLYGEWAITIKIMSRILIESDVNFSIYQ